MFAIILITPSNISDNILLPELSINEINEVPNF